MYGSEDSFGPTLASAGTTVLLGYLGGTWWKKKPGSLAPALTEGLVAAGGLGFRNMVRRPYINAMLEGAGYGAAYGLGEVIAANTTTLGKVAPGPLSMNRSSTTGFVGNRGQVNAAFVPPAPQQQPTWSPWAQMGYGA